MYFISILLLWLSNVLNSLIVKEIGNVSQIKKKEN